MFGRKQRIIETQKALIADLKEINEHNAKVIMLQHEQIVQLGKEIKTLRACINAADIDFPNSEKGGSDHTGAVNVSDILQN